MKQPKVSQHHKNTSFYLITTADERTWKFDKPVIFLDDKCLTTERKQIWQNLDHCVFEEDSNFMEDKIKLTNEVKNRISAILIEIVSILNDHHQTSFSPNFWQILIGHWLEIYVGTFLEREHQIKAILKSKIITGATFIKIENSMLVPRDLNSMVQNFKNPAWQSSIDLKILSNLTGVSFNFDSIEESFNILPNEVLKVNSPLSYKFSSLIMKAYNKVAISLTRNNEAFINSTYLPPLHEALLELSYFQLPKSWRPSMQYTEFAAPDLDLRKNLCKKLLNGGQSDLIKNELFNLIPICYLEGFSNLYNEIQKVNLPKNPKFIFTSNDFASYELFKMYAAVNSERKIQYIVGQHGNQYGTNRLSSPMLEERTCSKFITWGWESFDRRYVPGFVFKGVGRKLTYDHKGGLVLVLFPLGIGRDLFSANYLPNLYFDDQKKFLGLLNNEIVQKVTLRFHRGTTNSIESDVNKFKEINSSFLIDSSGAKIEELISRNRLCIFSYDSTGLLENLAMNIPTLAYWQFEMQHLNEKAKFYYQLLVDVGIIHFSPESAAKKINQIWDDVDTWWRCTTVQIAREQFCNEYARSTDTPIRTLRRIIKSV
jgi:putative transferase (TIGR04331 family)